MHDTKDGSNRTIPDIIRILFIHDTNHCYTFILTSSYVVQVLCGCTVFLAYIYT